MSDTHILGISAFYHDSAACLLRDGEIVAAAQEERFTRKKGDAAFPHRGRRVLPARGRHHVADLDLRRLLRQAAAQVRAHPRDLPRVAPRGFRSFLHGGPAVDQGEALHRPAAPRRAAATRATLLFAEHHESHAASAFFPSPFEEAAILTMDGVGEWATASIGVGRGNDIEILKELHWPDSLGLLYSAFTYYTGFKVNSGEYKVMGLAPYGEPKYVDLIYKRPDRPEGGRLVHAEQEVLQLPDRAHDDERGVRRAVRRPAARARDQADAAGDGPRALGAGRVRGGHAADGAHRAPARPGWRTSAWRAASRSTASATAGSCARARSSDSGSSPPPATPAARSASRSSSGTASCGQPAHRRRPGKDAMKGAYLGPEFSPDRDRDVPASRQGATYERLERAELLPSAWPSSSRTRRSSAGSRAAWSSGRARSARAASSATRAARGCRRR